MPLIVRVVNPQNFHSYSHLPCNPRGTPGKPSHDTTWQPRGAHDNPRGAANVPDGRLKAGSRDNAGSSAPFAAYL